MTSSPELAGEVSEDALLGGRVKLLQPKDGYRAAIDPVLLAAAVKANPGQKVLDLGCGAGAAALCLLHRVKNLETVGLELQPHFVNISKRNAVLNGFEASFHVVTGDLTNPPACLKLASFDHVMANPPFLDAGRGNPPPNLSKAVAHVEEKGDLRAWIDCCLAMVRPKGSITLIHRADRLDEILALLWGRAGEVVVFPLWPNSPEAADAKPAKRVLISGRKGIATPLRLSPGLVLHGPDGGYTKAAEVVLRDGEALHL